MRPEAGYRGLQRSASGAASRSPSAPRRGAAGGSTIPDERTKREAAAEGSAARTIDVLEYLARRTAPAPAAIIASACGIPRSSLYALLRLLRARRFVIYHPAEKSWSLGAAAHELSATAPLFAHGLAVLRAFASASGGLTPREIALRGELPRSVVDRIVPSLEECDLLNLEPDGTYTLGLELVSLSSRVGSIDLLRLVARDQLVQLRDATRETASLLVMHGQSALYVDQVESPYALRISGWVGRHVPLEGSATGAAFADPSTSHLVRDIVEQGVTSIACAIPIRDQTAAVNILAPSWRLQEFGEGRARHMVEAVAHKIALRYRQR